MSRLSVVLLLSIIACNEAPSAAGNATLAISADLAGSAAATVIVEVTGPDLTSPMVFNLPVSNGVASGSVTVPAGSARTIAMHAYDTGGIETHSGSVTLDIPSGTNPQVTIVLTPATGDVPITATLGSITVTVTPPSLTLSGTGTGQLAASMRDSNGNPVTGTVAWATRNPGVASVSATGLVTAEGAGSTQIVATFRGAAASVTVTVSP